MKYWKITFSLKRGKSGKYKKQLAYINRNYKPHYLSIAQLSYFDHFRSNPIPQIQFIVYAYDAIHFMDDFIYKFPKVLVTGGASPYKWSKIPLREKKIRDMIKKRMIKEKKVADKYKALYKKRSTKK